MKMRVIKKRCNKTMLKATTARPAALAAGSVAAAVLCALALQSYCFTPTATAFLAQPPLFRSRARWESARIQRGRAPLTWRRDAGSRIDGAPQTNAGEPERNRRGAGRSGTALESSKEGMDTTQAVDAEFSDVPATGARGGNVEVPAEKAPEGERSRDRRRRRTGEDGETTGNRGSGSGRLPLPFFDVDTLGLRGRWEEMGGNFLLRPPNGQAPKALLHFLGGAFVGAAPHLTYNYLLSGLAEMGFLVVATPYPLDFDYLTV
ncbi:unnamed protein product, partial [Sphacelaria rigidula]